MKGLRTQESTKFNAFFALIQEAAKENNAVFFADAGDGNDFETPSMEGENMMGWLIPEGKVKEFEPLWKSSDVDDTWTDFFTWAVWTRNGDDIKIAFEN